MRKVKSSYIYFCTLKISLSIWSIELKQIREGEKQFERMKRISLNCGLTRPASSTHSRPSRFMVFASSSWLPNYSSLNNTFIASASSSFGGSGPHSSSIYTSPLFVCLFFLMFC